MKREFLTILIVAWCVSSQPYKAAKSDTKKTKSEPPCTVFSVTNNNQPTPQHADDTNAYAPHWNAAIKRPEWWLVFAAFLTFVSIFWQSCLIRQSVKEARIAAESAKESANAFITQNRPWFIATIQDVVHPDIEAAIETWKRGLNFQNFGKTPARIVAAKVELCIGDSTTEPPQTSLHERARQFNPTTIPQNDYIALPCEFSPKCPPPHQFGNRLKYGTTKDHLWIRGYIEYRGTFEKNAALANYVTEFSAVSIVNETKMRVWKFTPESHNYTK
jgi:hypothetical protein